MLITSSFLILNGRFETPDDPISYTLQRQDEASINYNLIAKQHFSKVKTCYVIPRPSRTLRSQPGPPTDHNPIVLHLSLLSNSATQAPSATATLPELPHTLNFTHPNSRILQRGKKSQMPSRINPPKHNRTGCNPCTEDRSPTRHHQV